MSKLGVRLYGRMPGCDSEEVSSILTPLTILILLVLTACTQVTVVQRTGDANCKDSETDARMIQNL